MTSALRTKATNTVRRVERYVYIAEDKARLSELVEKATSGEEILIARDPKPAAKLVAACLTECSVDIV